MARKKYFQGSLIRTTQQNKTRVAPENLLENEAVFFQRLKDHDYQSAIALIPSVENINALDPETGMTVLHWAAAHRVNGLLDALYQRRDLNELAQDHQGRYASDLAWTLAEDEELGATLMQREKRYGERTGQAIWPKLKL